MVSPLNPNLPQSNSIVEVAAELRGIKGVLVDHQEGLAEQWDAMLPLRTAGVTGKNLLAAGAQIDAYHALGFKQFIQDFVRVDTKADAVNLLGLAGLMPTIQTDGNRRAIIFPGGFKINAEIATIQGSNASNRTFLVPYTNAVWGFAALSLQDSQFASSINSYSLEGYQIEQSTGSNKNMCIISIGI